MSNNVMKIKSVEYNEEGKIISLFGTLEPIKVTANKDLDVFEFLGIERVGQ